MRSLTITTLFPYRDVEITSIYGNNSTNVAKILQNPVTLHSAMEERPRNGGPDEGMYYLEGMGYKCILGSTSRSLGSEYSDANRSAKNNSDFYYYYGAV